MNIILLGAPGSGKGTQAAKIVEKYDLPHISTGDIFRYNIKNGTEIGLLAKSFIDRGELVPDSVTVAIVKDRLMQGDCAKGYILDGFPRTVEQAEALAKFSNIDLVIDIDVDVNLLTDRLTGRRVCSKCGASYHVSTYSDTKCSKCNADLIQRADDTVETVSNRLKVYSAQTAPLIDYYASKGVLATVNGSQGIDEVFQSICEVINKK